MDYIDQMVTPLAGVWIEIKSAGEDVGAGGSVTPLAGVWIEMATAWQYISTLISSHPSRVCGLKCGNRWKHDSHRLSHPSRVCGLKWRDNLIEDIVYRHTPRGCVD